MRWPSWRTCPRNSTRRARSSRCCARRCLSRTRWVRSGRCRRVSRTRARSSTLRTGPCVRPRTRYMCALLRAKGRASANSTTRALAATNGEAGSLARQLEDARAACCRQRRRGRDGRAQDGAQDAPAGRCVGYARCSQLGSRRRAHRARRRAQHSLGRTRPEGRRSERRLHATQVQGRRGRPGPRRSRARTCVPRRAARRGSPEALLQVAALGKELIAARERLDGVKTTDTAQDDPRSSTLPRRTLRRSRRSSTLCGSSSRRAGPSWALPGTTPSAYARRTTPTALATSHRRRRRSSKIGPPWTTSSPPFAPRTPR